MMSLVRQARRTGTPGSPPWKASTAVRQCSHEWSTRCCACTTGEEEEEELDEDDLDYDDDDDEGFLNELAGKD